MLVAPRCDTGVAINEPSLNHHFSPHSPFTKREDGVGSRDKPAGGASFHEFDFHRDDKKRLGNNPFHPPLDDANRPAVQIRPVSTVQNGLGD